MQGLPLEINDDKNRNDWIEGQYSISKELKTDLTIDEYIQYLNLPKNNHYNKFNMIKGFYSDSLQDNLIEQYKLKPAIFINIDCDIYTSTAEVLDFIFRNKLYENGKTIIRYDDWGGDFMKKVLRMMKNLVWEKQKLM